jgi:phosphatidylserine decarboxylase
MVDERKGTGSAAGVVESIFSVLAPVHREGYLFILIFGGISLILFAFAGRGAGWLGVAATVWCAYFFRDPARVTPLRDGLVPAPADGRIMAIEEVEPAAELDLGSGKCTRISIFMNLFDCHVNRIPVPGKVVNVAYRPGKFINAELDKASEENEANAVVVETAEGQRVGVVQIAGLVARRIVCFVKEGETLQAGDRFGLIRFGSRLDVYLPAGRQALACIGQRAIAGETVLDALKGDEPSRESRKS